MAAQQRTSSIKLTLHLQFIPAKFQPQPLYMVSSNDIFYTLVSLPDAHGMLTTIFQFYIFSVKNSVTRVAASSTKVNLGDGLTITCTVEGKPDIIRFRISFYIGIDR